MQEETLVKLLRLNRRFYQTFARSFAETRGRLQPGVAQVLSGVPPEASVLDLGCGHGQLSRALAEQGHHGRYVGLDASADLLQLAREQDVHPQARYYQADLADSNWAQELRNPFERIFAFAVLHHLPAENLRQQVLKKIRGLCVEGGRLDLSVWNFTASPRLRARVVPWEQVGLNPSQVEPGDYLLDWRRGGYGLRYVHLFEEGELEQLAHHSGFEVKETFYSDGEGGRLGLYQIWKPNLARSNPQARPATRVRGNPRTTRTRWRQPGQILT